MWIAKPLSALDSRDLEAWERTLQASRFREAEIPLAQSRAWAHATESLGARCWWVGSLESPVGGLIYADPRQAGTLECQNGPLLDWDQPKQIAGQLALFAQACSQVLGPRFRALRARPRWLEAKLESRLALLPVEAASLEMAETRVLPVLSSDAEQLASFEPRLRRTIRRGFGACPTLEWRRLDLSKDANWIQAFQRWGAHQSFFVPTLHWFETLSANLPLYLATARDDSSAAAGGLYALHQGTAHYLYGAPVDAEKPRSRVALGALVQFIALRNLAEQKVSRLDLNGDLSEAPPNHPYRSVATFKAQFRGEPIRYAVPEFRVES